MDEGSSFSNRFSWLTQKPRTKEWEYFLDTLPKPALLVDLGTWIITYANSRASDFTNYTRSELIGSDLRSLFSDWKEPKLDQGAAFAFSRIREIHPPMHLVRRDQAPALSKIILSPLKNNDKYGLLILEEPEIRSTENRKDLAHPFYANLNELLSSESVTELNSGFEKACRAASSLSGADIVCVYRLMDEAPEIRRMTSIGDDSLLPDTLDMQDLVSLNEPRFWEIGKQPSCSLYRNARASGIRYLASAPIGQNTALIGIVVLAGTSSADSKSAVEIARLLSRIIGNIFQRHVHNSNVQEELTQRSQIAARLSKVAEQVQEGVMRLSPELKIRDINPRLEQILGFLNREVEGEDAEMILIGNDQIPNSLHSASEGTSIEDKGDVRLFRRDGQPFQAMVRIFPVVHEEKVDEILVFIQDMSEKEQIRIHAQELENRAWLGELMAVFAHEVRNPINNISTGLQLMGMQLSPEDSQQIAISRMLQDCDRLEQLVKSVLGFSKPIEYEMENLDLGVMLQKLFDRQRTRLTNSKIRFELQINPNCPMVSGHLRSLEQVFNNLITNAVQAMGEDEGVLTIKVNPSSDNNGSSYVDIYVADNGPGIPKDIQEKIFQPFLTTKQNGTGLGLSIAKRIITAHRGNIQLSSFPGGTVFHIQLPAVSNEARDL